MKYVSIDIETLGLNIKAPIIEVACVFVNHGKIIDRRQTYVLHPRYDNCEPFAMAMHPIILQRIATREAGFDYIPIDWLANTVLDWCIDAGFKPQDERIVFAGKNAASFDLPMLNLQTEGVFNDLVNPHHRVLDPGPMFSQRGQASIPSLKDIVEQEKLNVQVTHTALDDALAVVAAVEHFFDLQEEARNNQHILDKLRD